MDLPEVFCWSKFGAEAGEPAEEIVRRKESERVLNGGVFLWGIGNSIRPSLVLLLRQSSSPEVLFTPMLSRAASGDESPKSVVLWREAVGFDGAPYVIPRHSAVTSKESGRGHHFALVCHSDDPLDAQDPAGHEMFGSESVRNLRTGSPVGSSQVTSIVARTQRRTTTRSVRMYSVAFRARLTYPFFVTLRGKTCIGGEVMSPFGKEARNLDTDSAPGDLALCLF